MYYALQSIINGRRHPEQLVSLQNTVGFQLLSAFSYPNYKDFRDRNDVLAGLIGYRFAPLSVSHDGVNEKLWGYIVTGNYFEVLGVKAALGRAISPHDDRLPGAHPVTVLSYQYWQQRFGGDPGVIGKNLIVNGRSFTVIGVAPQGFFGTEIIAAPELWFPMAMQSEIEVGSNWLEKRDVEVALVQGRLKSGVSIAQARAALNSIALQLEREFPEDNEGKRVILSRGRDFIRRLPPLVVEKRSDCFAGRAFARAPGRRRSDAARTTTCAGGQSRF